MLRTCLILLAAAHATLLADWSLEEIARRSDLVIVGTVIEQRSVHERSELMTETQIRVEETLKGTPVPSIILSQLGGREGSKIAEVDGDARLKMGERFVLFTYQHRDGRRYLVGMGLGAYAITGDRAEPVLGGRVLGGRALELDGLRAVLRK